MKRKMEDTEGTQLFNVPMTDEGRVFIKLARKFANKKVLTDIKVIYRGTRRGVHHTLVADATWIAVYGEICFMSMSYIYSWRKRIKDLWKESQLDKEE